jgi:PEP-CTERM motif
MKPSVFLQSLALLTLPHLTFAQGNLIFNGGFDTSANGWTIINTPGGFGYSSAGGNPGGCVLLDNISPSLSSDPTASQTVSTLTPGITYVVSGDYQLGKDRGGGSVTDASFGVAIDGNVLFAAVAPGNFTWQHFSFSYIASSSSATLSLSSQINGTGFSYGIDNIRIQVVPEPSLMSLLGVSGLAFYWRIRRLTAYERVRKMAC